VPDLFLDETGPHDGAAGQAHEGRGGRRSSPGLASLVSSLALLQQTEPHVAQNLSAGELVACKAAFAAVQDALSFAKGMPGLGTELVDMADSAVQVAESLMKTGASALLGSSLLPMLEAKGNMRLLDLGSKLGGKDEALCGLVEQVVGRVKALARGEVTMIPCGWTRAQQNEGRDGKQGKAEEESHCLLVVVGRGADSTYKMAVCNSGEGRHLHAATVAAPTGQDQLALSAYLEGIAAERICDGAFWFLLLRPMVLGLGGREAVLGVYRLFPFLNRQPLTSKQQTLALPPADWAPASGSRDPSHAALVFGPAFRAALRSANRSPYP
jgi:hypothetical protein